MVSAGNGWFTFLGFAGMYTLLSFLFLFLIRREIEHGPEPVPASGQPKSGRLEPVGVK
jgi:cytochrome d ubiquinol oxidase subunit I